MITRPIKVRELVRGDVLVFDGDTKRTIKNIVPSSIDPVNLIYFDETDESIAKDPADVVMVEV